MQRWGETMDEQKGMASLPWVSYGRKSREQRKSSMPQGVETPASGRGGRHPWKARADPPWRGIQGKPHGREQGAAAQNGGAGVGVQEIRMREETCGDKEKN
ncbi:hypothetical protein Zm00014a_014532 [Zea mays]|uniref:Uncharacterized protein n=1 Tax=Zea mays TaxID=4577 RepID=A0A3L6D8G2_MAIZE|nr:hypothetical protein Zm00014a_014532 [Zea mays]